MKTRLVHSFVLIFAACAPALSAQSSPSPKTTAASSAKSFEAAAVVPPALSATVVEYGERDVLRLKAKLRYTTLIVLPKNEQILDFTCGDKEFWIVNGTQNFAYVKPARANSQTNLNLITASGNVYSFVLSEVSGSAGFGAGSQGVRRAQRRPNDLGLEWRTEVCFRSPGRRLPSADRDGEGGDAPDEEHGSVNHRP